MRQGIWTENVVTVTTGGLVTIWFAIEETFHGVTFRYAEAWPLSCPTGARVWQKNSNQHKAQQYIHESSHLQKVEVKDRGYCWIVWLKIFLNSDMVHVHVKELAIHCLKTFKQILKDNKLFFIRYILLSPKRCHSNVTKYHCIWTSRG